MASQGTKSMLDKKPLLILMDGHAMVYRAWHAIQQPLNVRRTGEEVRAVFGFLNTFLRSLARLGADALRDSVRPLRPDLPAPPVRRVQGTAPSDATRASYAGRPRA